MTSAILLSEGAAYTFTVFEPAILGDDHQSGPCRRLNQPTCQWGTYVLPHLPTGRAQQTSRLTWRTIEAISPGTPGLHWDDKLDRVHGSGHPRAIKSGPPPYCRQWSPRWNVRPLLRETCRRRLDRADDHESRPVASRSQQHVPFSEAIIAYITAASTDTMASSAMIRASTAAVTLFRLTQQLRRPPWHPCIAIIALPAAVDVASSARGIRPPLRRSAWSLEDSHRPHPWRRLGRSCSLARRRHRGESLPPLHLPGHAVSSSRVRGAQDVHPGPARHLRFIWRPSFIAGWATRGRLTGHSDAWVIVIRHWSCICTHPPSSERCSCNCAIVNRRRTTYSCGTSF